MNIKKYSLFEIGFLYLWCISVAAQPVKQHFPLPTEEVKTLASVYGLLQDFLPEAHDAKASVVAAIRGMIREVDPDGGDYFTKEEFSAFIKKGNPPNWESIGLEVRFKGGGLILFPIVGGPASSAGLRQGDKLWSIDGKVAFNFGMNQIHTKFSGPVGTMVTLGVIRSNAPFAEISVERKNFELPGPNLRRLQTDIALLTLSFGKNTMLEETASILRREWIAQPYRRGLILDLRDNPGGLLMAYIGLAAIFLPPDVLVVKTSGERPDANYQYKATKADYVIAGTKRDPIADLAAELKTVPLVVLVNDGTIAGAEIVAAALKDHNRAKLVGKTTFGRGSIQTLVPLPGGSAIKHTKAYWTRPSGARVHGVGVSPDVYVEQHDPQLSLAVALEILRSPQTIQTTTKP